METLRVLRIQSRICIGGPALNSIYLSAHLGEPFQTILVGGRLESGESTLEPLAHDLGVPIKILDDMGRRVSWLDDWRAFRTLIKIIRLYRPHIVHTHTAKAGALGRLAAFFCRVPIRVHTFHGHVFEGYFSRWGNLAVRWAERGLALISTAIVAISPRQQDDLIRRFRITSHRKCHVIRLGFKLKDLSKGRPGVFRQQLGIPEAARFAAIIARLVPVKNHSLLLESLSIWLKQSDISPDQFRLAIIGDGELRATLEEQCRALNLEAWVTFTGWQTNMADIYADIDLNVLVSRNEGTPVTLIEGLAAGVPLITTDVGGVRDIVEPDQGIVIDPQSKPETLAEALKQWWLSPSPRLSPEAQLRIRNQFSVERLVNDMEALYRSLL
ncbi:MAG: glycosyltransferase [Acidobacteria bacterium]|nr:glycosyltransferase [Acidobacteriota bacterium]